jgi:hypothetical protein
MKPLFKNFKRAAFVAALFAFGPVWGNGSLDSKIEAVTEKIKKDPGIKKMGSVIVLEEQASLDRIEKQ